MQIRVFLLGTLFSVSLAAVLPRSTDAKFKICVPEIYYEQCKQLEAVQGVRLTCVSSRDRLECLDKVHSGDADFVPVDPEDMYVAGVNSDNHYTVFKEIRTLEEPSEEFRYEAVAVVHKNLNINSVQGLKGLKSCHTGVGRNVGYKIPLTRLSMMHVIGEMNDRNLTSRENELRALSGLFSQACLVGKWSEDPELNTRLKKEYANLCALCEHPSVCDYPDTFSGYDGALRCLSDNGGQVAWTKVYFVKKHFGIAIGGDPTVVAKSTAYNPNDYAYLCPDGSKKPILGRACRWAARPWQGFLANDRIGSDIPDLREQLSLANTLGQTQDADWLEKVLAIIKNKTTVVDNAQPISPREYLDKANYTDVIGRNFGPDEPIKFCVRTTTELAKCQSLQRAAFSRDIRPKLGCVLKADLRECLAAIRDGQADVITVDGGESHIATREFHLKPVLTEVYGEHDALYYAVAVVKKGSKYNSFADLRGARSCHTGFGRTAGWNVPLYSLHSGGLLNSNTCPPAKAMSEFFSGGSCVPGALLESNNPSGQNPSNLCNLCAGNLDTKDISSKCNYDSSESFFGYAGAFRCLAAGSGDVAFIKHATVLDNTDGHNSASWAANLHAADFELLCPGGGRKPVINYTDCNLAEVPAHTVVTNKDKSVNEVEAIRQALLAVAKLYSKRPDLFKLFGSYSGKHDLLFKDSATGLRHIDGESPTQVAYDQILENISKLCSTTKVTV